MTTRKNKVQFWVNDSELTKLDALAQSEGIGRSEWIRKIVEREYVDKKDRNV